MRLKPRLQLAMKALLLAPEFTRDGGVQRILRLYLAALAADPLHHSMGLVALNDTPSELSRQPWQVSGMVAGKPIVAVACSRSKVAFARATRLAARDARRIVCGHLGQLPVAALAARPGARLAVVAHGIEAWTAPGLLRRLALARCHRVLCVSRYTRDQLARHVPGLAPRLRVVPNALDPALLDRPPPGPPPPGPPTILCVGRLCAADAYKGYDLLLRAFALLPPGRAARLRYVGDGDDRARLERLARELRLEARVTFSGRIDDEALRMAFSECACFALPSTGEGFGLVYLEALAAGRPCVGVHATAVPELLGFEAGELAPPGDPAALAGALIACLDRNWDPLALRAVALRYDLPHLAKTLTASWEN